MYPNNFRSQFFFITFLLATITSCTGQDRYAQENCEDYKVDYRRLASGDSVRLYEGCMVDGKRYGTHLWYNKDETVFRRAEYSEHGHTMIEYHNERPVPNRDSIIFDKQTKIRTRYTISSENKLLAVQTRVKIGNDTYYSTFSGDVQNGHIYNRKNQAAQLSVHYREGIRYPDVWTDTTESVKVQFYFNKNDGTTDSKESYYFFSQEVSCEGCPTVTIKNIQDTVPLILLSVEDQKKLSAIMEAYNSKRHVVSERSGGIKYNPVYLKGRPNEKELQKYFIDKLNSNLIIPSVFEGLSTQGNLAIYFNSSGEVVGVYYFAKGDEKTRSYLSKQVIGICYLTLPSELVPTDAGTDAIYVTSFEYNSSLR